MKLVIPATNVKHFGKTIHCMAKVGEEIYVEPSLDGLTLKTVNSCR